MIKIISKPKPKISISKKSRGNFEEIKKDFNELRHKFSEQEIDKFRKSFYVLKNRIDLPPEEIREAEKNLTELENTLKFKKFKKFYRHFCYRHYVGETV